MDINLFIHCRDMEYIAKLAFNRGYYDRAVEWMEHSIALMEKDPIFDDRVKAIFAGTMDTMKSKHDQVLMTKGPR